ncbi:hypothetical protein HAX54_045763 [Datura stramonium]|uniref:RNA 3'-terminal phosphate cyclase domain-containing protein n=1 Tax=Datura stramonium TaxID=4076 RepID=A0ABS8WG40_DATST|nr:hypothetical protein [Datura stramonium]
MIVVSVVPLATSWKPLIMLGLFGKKPLTIRLKGITNDSKDPSIDTFRSTTLPILKQFGVPAEGLELKIESRGVTPKGGGEVVLLVPMVLNSLKVQIIKLEHKPECMIT